MTIYETRWLRVELRADDCWMHEISNVGSQTLKCRPFRQKSLEMIDIWEFWVRKIALTRTSTVFIATAAVSILGFFGLFRYGIPGGQESIKDK